MSTSLSYRSRAQTLLSQHGDDGDDEDDDDDTADIAKAVSDKPETAATRHASLLRPPTVQLRSPLNVHSWEIGRQILVRFGKPKRNRIDMYSGFYLLYMALIILAESICVDHFNEALNLQLILLKFSHFAFQSLPIGTTLDHAIERERVECGAPSTARPHCHGPSAQSRPAGRTRDVAEQSPRRSWRDR